jgi:hypothetical protein
LSYKADNFGVKRRIVFFNGITNDFVLEIIGFCSIYKDNMDNQLEVTCKVSDNNYKKHYFGLSDNTAYFIEQVNSETVSGYRYKINFRPSTVIPDVDIKVGG